jgi:transmembrane sensor
MNYCQFDAEDFAADDYFKDWVCSPTLESDLFWQAFYEEYPEKYYALEEAKLLVNGLYTIHNSAVSDEQLNSLWSRIEETVSTTTIRGSGRWVKIRHLRVAASILVLMSFGWLLYQKFKPEQFATVFSSADGTNLIEIVNRNNEAMPVKLSDGSLVMLQKESSIKYPEQFTGHLRTVFLKGGAYFEVEKDPLKPFLVYANGLVTRVLGTSFTIQARDDQPNVTVSVKTGRVSVYSDKSFPDPETKGIILSPNQKAVFQKETAVLTKTLVEAPRILVKNADLPSFVFEDQPASAVFATLEKVYGIDVVYDEELMKTCTVTINLNEEDLFEKLEVICKVLDATYKLIDAQVIIYSKGC